MTSPVQGESICPVINAYRANKAQLDAFHFDRPSDDDIQSMFHGLERDLGVESDRLTVDNKWKIVHEREKRRWHEEKDRQQDLEQRLADTDGSPSIGVSDGQAYIEKFMSSTITPKDLQGLGVSLRTMPLAWFSSFIEMKGIAVLAFQLNVLNRPGFSRGEVEAQQEIEILKCLKTILNSPVGQREVTSKQTTVNHIITVLGSPHMPSRKLGLKLIVALCYLDDRSLQSVLMALEAFSNSNQENGAFTFWFKVTLATMLGHEAMKIPADASEDFEKTVRTEVSLDGYILNTLMFINGILNRTVDPKTRKSLRANMELAGLQDIVELAQELQEDNLMSDMKQLSVSTEEDLDGLSGEAEQLNGTSEAPQYFSARATAKSSQITQNLSELKANPSGQIRRGRRNKSLIPSYDGSINNPSYGVAESTDNNQNSTNRKDSLITAKEKPQGSSLPRRAQRVPRGYKRLSRSEIADTPAGAAPISRGMSPSVISRCLTQHGCSDITHRLNPASCSEHPVSNGGFGDVYQARLDDGSLVAVKCTRVTNDSLDRLKNQNLTDAAREIHAWSKLKHRYILKLFGLALFRGQVAMISPWIQRGSLVSYLENRPELNRLRLCTQIAEGLTYLHQSGVVHGDLKGANILMSETDEPLLADFGNAVLQERTLKFTYTTTRTALSPRWTAPELLSDRPCSFEADVYAFGMTILEIVTGSAPFSELRSDMAVMFAISQGKLPARPENHIPTGSKNADFFWLLLNRCWSFEPGCRVRMVEVKHGIMAI